MIARVWAIGLTGFVQLLRSRVYLNILVAGVGLVVASLLFDELSAGEGGRVLFDVGLAFSSLLVAVLAGVLSITTLTRELETKQAHLILARPIARGELVIGRFITTALLILFSNLVLGGLLSLLLVAVGASGAGWALAACLFASLEAFVVAALALFFGVGSSSTMSAVFTVTFFVAGRLTGELQTLIESGKFAGATPVLKAAYAALLHLAALDLTALRAAPAGGPVNGAAIASAAAYAAAYTVAFLAFAVFRINRRDLL
jgi:ABC-type transport system involved in multi-copper enzyme maturation permease subunit